MPLAGPNPGATCSYNGVSFTSLYKTSVSAKPILDEAERTTVYVEHTLTVEGYIASIPTDATLASMRSLLTACGGDLVYTNKGFGDLSVNGASPKRDVAWGPIPEILEWMPLGGDGNAARVTWRVTTRIPECSGATHYTTPSLLAYNYEITFDIDESGYTSYTFAGYIEIPMTRLTQATRTMPDSVDVYRPLVNIPVPLGFQRKNRSFRTSKDKRRLDFSITDEEMPAALPDDVTRCEARQTISAPMPFQQWAVSIDVTITLARGKPKTDAFANFILVLESRLNKLRKNSKDSKQGLLAQRYAFEDDIFGRTSRFSVTFMAIGFTISEVLNLSGIWTPIAGTDYGKWTSSLQVDAASGIRGWAGAQNNPNADIIIDLCLTGNNTPPPPIKPKPPPLIAIKLGETNKPIVKDLNPNNSWWHYEWAYEWRETSNVVRHKPLPKPPNSGSAPVFGVVMKTINAVGKYSGPPATDDSQDNATGGIGSGDTTTSYPADVFQRAATPTRTLIFTGWAVRLGYRIPAPKIPSVAGVTPVEMDRHVWETGNIAIGSVVLWRTAWRIVYAVDVPPGGPLPYPGNPVFDTPGGAGVASPLTP